MRHTLAVLVENHPGVLSRVAGLFTRRGYNIESLAVGITEDPVISRMTIVVDGDDRVIEQLDKQLQKLVSVLKVTDLGAEEHVERELALIKVSADPETRARIREVAEIFRARIVDVGQKTVIVEITGDREKVDALLALLEEFGVREVVRTGAVAMARGGAMGSSRGRKKEADNGTNVLRWRRRSFGIAGEAGSGNRLR